MIQALLGRKLGMTRLFDENGVVTASTLVEAGPCFITQLRTQEVDGYTAVQLGFGDKPRPKKPDVGSCYGAHNSVHRLVTRHETEPQPP